MAAERERARADAAEARLEKLLAAAGIGSGRRRTVMSLRMEVVRLRAALQASKAAARNPKPPPRPDSGLTRALERSQAQKDTIQSLRREAAAQRKAPGRRRHRCPQTAPGFARPGRVRGHRKT